MFSLVNHFGIRKAGFIEGNILFCNIIRHIPEGQFDTFHTGIHFPSPPMQTPRQGSRLIQF